jgi:hypothetical protein
MKILETYQCETCGNTSSNKSQVLACESIPLETPIFEVGEIVFVKNGFGWFDGEPAWISNFKAVQENRTAQSHGNCFQSCCTYRFYYVITAIEQDGHRLKYYVVTNAMTGTQGHRGGYTYTKGHITPQRAGIAPPLVTQQAQKLIGEKPKMLI